jgi:hypothetical protein
MARKKDPTKELKDQRVPIMMTATELALIDDWGFGNRIRSRGEAIRRLCFVGLMMDEREQQLRPVINKLINGLINNYPSNPERFRNLDEDGLKKFNSENIIEIISSASFAYTELIEPLYELLTALEAVRTEKNLNAAVEMAQKSLSSFRSKRDAEILERKSRDLFSGDLDSTD